MAARELERSDRAEMRAFGESIVESQTAQIDQMEEWLEEWYADRSGQVDYSPMMRDLSDLSGDELDEVFLEDMVGHHMAAVMMSQHCSREESPTTTRSRSWRRPFATSSTTRSSRCSSG